MTYDTINDAQTVAGGGTGMVLVGRYRVIRQLGHGGMGSVWLAEDMQLDNKPFAVKMLPSILVSNKRAYRQLKDEALVAMKLVHPNIVQIRAFEENNGNPFLVMDYIDGQALDDYLAEHTGVTDISSVANAPAARSTGRTGGSPVLFGLTESEVIRILKPIAAALDYAHGEGVVHRDVKPANVMIRKDGHPFILDFGIAREIQETMTRVTGKLSSGTLLYMSPEQNNGDEPTAAQDVYSFAAMAYECLVGRPPFTRGNIEDQIKNKIPDPPPGGSGSIASSVMAGLAKKPEDRPKNCAGVLGWKEGDVHGHKGELDNQAEADPSTITNKQQTEHSDDGLKTGTTKTLMLPGGEAMEMIYCAPGEYIKGSLETEVGRETNEKRRLVRIKKGFWLGKYPVTQRHWESVMGTNPSYFKGANLPVDSVSKNDCQKFIFKTFGSYVRLPTEDEWEYACRAGTTTAYSWGDSLNGDRANCIGKLPCGTTSKGPCMYKTTDVGRYGANPWGFCDMHGNIREWCDSLYVSDWIIQSIFWIGGFLPSIGLVLIGDDSSSLVITHIGVLWVFITVCVFIVWEISDFFAPLLVLRGGAWDCGARECRSASRSKDRASHRKNTYGFRLCCSEMPPQ